MTAEQKKTVRPRGTDGARVISVIVTEALEGMGTEEDPCRLQTRYWSLTGELLATEEKKSAPAGGRDRTGQDGRLMTVTIYPSPF